MTRGPARIRSTIGRLTAANALLLLGGFVTGPIQARALGPRGRGDLAAILSFLAFGSVLASVGLGSFASWAAARGRRAGELLGTFSLLYLLQGAVVAALAVPVAGVLSGGHHVVREFMIIGLLLLPLGLIGTLVLEIAIGAELWGAVAAFKALNALESIIPVVVLAVAGALTVGSAAIVSLAALPVFSVPLVAVRRADPGPLRWRPQLAREGMKFGVNAWAGGLAQLTNGQIDQALMLSLTTAKQLGLYAVAVSGSTFFLLLVINPLQTAIAPRIARGDHQLVHKGVRTAVAATSCCAVAVAAASPLLVRLMFGDAFSGAIPMVVVLAFASIPLSANLMLTSACSAAGHPRLAAKAEFLAVAITIPGLLLAVPWIGAIGAALVSALAYSVTTGYLVHLSRRLFGGTWGQFLKPGRSDLTLVIQMGRARLAVWARRGGDRNAGDTSHA